MLLTVDAEGKTEAVTFHVRGELPVNVTWAAKKLYNAAPEQVQLRLPELKYEVSWLGTG